mmetsp:Transcript_19942/g.44755  ORF Transcript_19942/g.44755 Transcript_19942/m.44755 type:complete len:228 (-) Transcript_19942:36-719(-)
MMPIVRMAVAVGQKWDTSLEGVPVDSWSCTRVSKISSALRHHCKTVAAPSLASAVSSASGSRAATAKHTAATTWVDKPSSSFCIAAQIRANWDRRVTPSTSKRLMTTLAVTSALPVVQPLRGWSPARLLPEGRTDTTDALTAGGNLARIAASPGRSSPYPSKRSSMPQSSCKHNSRSCNSKRRSCMSETCACPNAPMHLHTNSHLASDPIVDKGIWAAIARTPQHTI